MNEPRPFGRAPDSSSRRGRLAGIDVSDSAKAEVLAALAALVAADCWRPLGGK